MVILKMDGVEPVARWPPLVDQLRAKFLTTGTCKTLYPQFHWLRQLATFSPNSNVEF